MALLSRKLLVNRIRKGRAARKRLVESNLDKGVAYQIRNTRDARKMTQAQLAGLVGMSQNNISRLESPDYGKFTISSLKRIADAFDVALVVRFVPFSQYIDWLSGTPRIDQGLNASALAVPSFDKEEELNQIEENPLHIQAVPLSFNVNIDFPFNFTATPTGVVQSGPIYKNLVLGETLSPVEQRELSLSPVPRQGHAFGNFYPQKIEGDYAWIQ